MSGSVPADPVPAGPGVLLWVLVCAAGTLWCVIVGVLAVALWRLEVI